MPFVASAACWRKTVEVEEVFGSGIWQTSTGMERRWQAKMQFMMGMYWRAMSVEGETERRRMRAWRAVFLEERLDGSVVTWFAVASALELPVDSA